MVSTTTGGEVCNSGYLSLCLRLYNQMQQVAARAQILGILVDRILIVHSVSCKQHANYFRNVCIATCHGAGDEGWVAAKELRAEAD